MTWTEAAHPRNAKGPGGGEFKSSTGAKPAPAKKVAPARKRPTAAHGSMSFNGRTGTGYGSKNGDPRVKKLQRMLNRLHLTDAHGKPLAVDGKLGPLTTQAIKRWQRKNGMRPDGVVTTAMLAKRPPARHKKAALAVKKQSPMPMRRLVG